MADIVTKEASDSKPADRETVTVEAIKRRGFPGYYLFGKLFPNGQPVTIEVSTKDITKTKKTVDPDTDAVGEEKYIHRESELKQLLRHTAFLKVYRSTQTPVGGKAPVKAGTDDHLEANRAAIKESDAEAYSTGDKGPTGTKR